MAGTDQTGKTRRLTRTHQDAFLAAFAESGVVTAAAEAVGINRDRHYVWLHEEEGYEARFRQAQEDAADRLEQEARRRAVEGVEKGIYWQGKQIATEREYSDQLLALMLKGRRPEVYREKLDLNGNLNQTLSVVNIELVPKANRTLAAPISDNGGGH